MTRELKANGEPVTQAVFDRLPGLLTRAQFRWVTGLSSRDVDAMRQSGELKTHQSRKGGYHKYFKGDAARMAGFKL